MECKAIEAAYTEQIKLRFHADVPVTEYVRFQRETAQAIGKATGIKPVYYRKYKDMANRGFYVIGDWKVKSNYIQSRHFGFAELPQFMNVIAALGEMRLSGDFRISYCMNRQDANSFVNLWTILEARRTLIEKALGFDGLKLFANEEIALALPMETLSMPKVEALICVLVQAANLAENTNKARMKPCGETNPKFEMRSWLLRLGFIGEEFKRPRETLLTVLDGNASCFTDEVRERVYQNRKAARRIGR